MYAFYFVDGIVRFGVFKKYLVGVLKYSHSNIDILVFVLLLKKGIGPVQNLDPQAKMLIEKAESAGNPELYTLDPVAARKQFLELSSAVAIEPDEVGSVEDRWIKGSQQNIKIRLYRPSDASDKLPVIIYFHGGGWVIGDLDSHDSVCRKLCSGSGCVLVSVDYRLAPEHKFPAAVDDCFAATKWVSNNGSALGIENTRLAVAGDSAGGNLAAVVSHLARDAGGPNIAYQLLIYPATDMTMSQSSHQTLGAGYRLTKPLMEWFIDHYLNDESDRSDTRASPLFNSNFANLPETLLVTAGFDPLRDEGARYAERLVAGGIKTTYVPYSTMIHGFFGMGGWLDISRQALDYSAHQLRIALHN